MHKSKVLGMQDGGKQSLLSAIFLLLY